MSNQAELYACLCVKEFPAQVVLRLRTDLRDRAVVIVQGSPPMQTACSFNAKARKMGIVRGMVRIEIETFPSVIVIARSSAEEAAAKRVLLECAGTFSPRVEDHSDHTSFFCILDILGTEKLLGTPRALAQELINRVKALGIIASVVISRNVHAAISYLRGTSLQVSQIEAGKEGDALRPLPLAVLDLPPEQAETFSLWGIHTLGALAALPEKELIARMGQEGKCLRLMARGELPHQFVPIEPNPCLEEHMELDIPVEFLHSLLFVLGVMLEQLILRVTMRISALSSLTVTLFLEGGGTHNRVVRPALATNDRQLWVKLIQLDLEMHPPKARILGILLSAEEGRTSKVQGGLFSPQLPEPGRLDITLARVRAIVGENCVGRPVLQDTHQYDGFRLESFTIPSGKSIPAPSASKPLAVMRQLRPPENVSVTLRGERPSIFTFRGKLFEVYRAYGPWLTEGDWWHPGSWVLKQWDLIAQSRDGIILCCCLVLNQRLHSWRMVALYD